MIGSKKSFSSVVNDDLASRWYIPAEVESLRSLYPIVVIINFVSLVIFILRDAPDLIFYSSMKIVDSLQNYILLNKLAQ